MKNQNCYVYIHTNGIPSHLDIIPDFNQFGFDGSGVTEYEANQFIKAFNSVNSDRFAYAYKS